MERRITATDRFVPHDLDLDLVAEIRTKLAMYHEIDRAYLVRKPMQLFPEHSIYILAIKLAQTRSSIAVKEQLERELSQRLSIEIDLSKRAIIAIFDPHKYPSTHHRDLKPIDKIERISGSCIL